MQATGLLNGAPSWREGSPHPGCYPVARSYKDHLAPVVEYLQNFRHLTPIGRYGSFKYNNQDHSILMGMLAAENLLDGTEHDLWAVNSDYEAYQEAAKVQKVGLEIPTPVGGLRRPPTQVRTDRLAPRWTS